MQDGDNLGIRLLDAARGPARGFLQAGLYFIAPGIDVIDGEFSSALVQSLFDRLGDALIRHRGHCSDALAPLGGAV